MLIFDFRDIGNKLYENRKRLGMTQADVAEAAGLADRTYADIERGTVNMRIETFLRICAVLHVTPDTILTDQPKEHPMVEQIVEKLSLCTATQQKTALDLLDVYLNSFN